MLHVLHVHTLDKSIHYASYAFSYTIVTIHNLRPILTLYNHNHFRPAHARSYIIVNIQTRALHIPSKLISSLICIRISPYQCVSSMFVLGVRKYSKTQFLNFDPRLLPKPSLKFFSNWLLYNHFNHHPSSNNSWNILGIPVNPSLNSSWSSLSLILDLSCIT